MSNHSKAPTPQDTVLSGTGVVDPPGDSGSVAPHPKLFAMFAYSKPMPEDSIHLRTENGTANSIKPAHTSLPPQHPPTAHLGPAHHTTGGPSTRAQHILSSSSKPEVSESKPSPHNNGHSAASAEDCPDTDSPIVNNRRRPAVTDASKSQHIPESPAITQRAAGAWISCRPKVTTVVGSSPPEDDIITLDSPEPPPRQQARPAAQDPPKQRQRMIVDEGEDSDDEFLCVPQQAAPAATVVRKRTACLASPSSPEHPHQRQPHQHSHPSDQQKTASNTSAVPFAASPATINTPAFVECSASLENSDLGISRSHISSGSSLAASPLHTHAEPSKRLKLNDGNTQVVMTECNSARGALPLQQIHPQQLQATAGGLQPHLRVGSNVGGTPSVAPIRLGRLAHSALSLVPMRSITPPVSVGVSCCPLDCWGETACSAKSSKCRNTHLQEALLMFMPFAG